MYEALVDEAYNHGIRVEERELGKIQGLYGENIIWINKNLDTDAEKTSIFAEEMGHHFTSHGNITNLSVLKNRKQEHIARRWAVKKLIPLNKLVDAYKNFCISKHEIAEYLNVTEHFLDMGISYYREIYGTSVRVDQHSVLHFNPLYVEEMEG
ncbi:ImmA/IrrE family metallo-endopeptidase [Oceanobacillus kimchii]|uniref:ImmA/IrrE family metallo-endopeptidase n=1 Tax=Oceanobacillus kimchii TaxID=746691 RepID=UPI0021A3F840|nr:ImmA/IrrE family metallo-endopeptidase [Oceanobacillus kimchii]MCT1577570.1 ImmA/IrrE family metallo-endopeptidase [Oceanobacillus kimchii]MCT2136558.1 ImmA/IrrE family metallo-endopeptidase [Oceanobacillus kimchii]